MSAAIILLTALLIIIALQKGSTHAEPFASNAKRMHDQFRTSSVWRTESQQTFKIIACARTPPGPLLDPHFQGNKQTHKPAKPTNTDTIWTDLL